MLKIKSIEKKGKHLKITIKKPYLISLQKFMKKHNLLFSKYDDSEYMYNFNWCLTENKDIELDFILRNYDDIKPYLESKGE
jgi:hypothetical protein